MLDVTKLICLFKLLCGCVIHVLDSNCTLRRACPRGLNTVQVVCSRAKICHSKIGSFGSTSFLAIALEPNWDVYRRSQLQNNHQSAYSDLL